MRDQPTIAAISGCLGVVIPVVIRPAGLGLNVVLIGGSAARVVPIDGKPPVL